ncbi:MAG: DCC1-like thiol-disulfide oxidoreductase family protein [Planctomycetota bacterium]|jgi:predicted DCC family thiol-disulfide oxidoreductase YuxK|nr:DCC1-like thiol-disulfide oxidoreductase family protein [Planctomycetota bacterium]
MTEITKKSDILLVDIQCGLCRGLAGRLGRMLGASGTRIGSQQKAQQLGLLSTTADALCLFERRTRRMHKGVDALVQVMQRRRVAWVWARILRLPGIYPMACHGYAWIARHRHQLSCQIDRGQT